MSMDAFWTRDENQQYRDFYFYWDTYHSDDQQWTEDPTGGAENWEECAWVPIEASCADFQFLADEECRIHASYSPCETDYFFCQITQGGDYDRETSDCTEDFTNPEFWSAMSQENWWGEHPEHEGFYMFWVDFHSGNRDYDDYQAPDCYWREVHAFCSDFDFIPEEDECEIYTSYNPCVKDHFICESTSRDDYGERQTDDCTYNFLDVEFWSAMREENWWNENEQYRDFFQYWEDYHFGDNAVCEHKQI